MNRTGLVIALAVAVVAGLVFALYPELDLAVSRWFYDPAIRDFPLRLERRFILLRNASMWVIAALTVPFGVALVLKLLLPSRPMLIPGRAVLFVLATLVLGPGLFVNVTMKEHWPRSRPIDVPQLGGQERFVPWWDPRGECPKNCSFPAGESSGAFWTLAPAALTPPHWRALAYTGALAFGAAVGGLRIAFGGHFFSDVVFAGIFIFLIVWVVHGLIYRSGRLSDADVERAVACVTWPIRRAFRGSARAGGKGGETP